MSRTVLNKSDVYRGDLILVNARCGLKEQENSDLVPAMGNPDILLQRRSSAALDRLIDRIDGAGDIVPVSGWRSFREQDVYKRQIKDSFVKLNPKTQVKNPVMLLVFISAILTTILWVVSLFGIKDAGSGFTLAIAIILWFTVQMCIRDRPCICASNANHAGLCGHCSPCLLYTSC